MGRKRSGRGPRRDAGRRASPARDPRRSDAAHNRADPAAGAKGSSRLRLTRLLREGAIWDVYIATTSGAGAPNETQLEFESGGAAREKLRYRRPVEGPLLEALHSGAPVSRASLEDALELAIREAGTVDSTPGAL